jgi:hypothetical protein
LKIQIPLYGFYLYLAWIPYSSGLSQLSYTLCMPPAVFDQHTE